MGKSRHERLKQHIKHHPRIVGIENVLVATEEIEFYTSNGSILCAPDLFFVYLPQPKRVALAMVEVKGCDEQRNLDRADTQLDRGKDYLSNKFSLPCKVITAYLDTAGRVRYYERQTPERIQPSKGLAALVEVE